MSMPVVFFLVIRNGCAVDKCHEMHSGLPLTTKRNKDAHGFGLRSVRAAVERRGGVLAVNLDRPGVFETVISLPLSDERT